MRPPNKKIVYIINTSICSDEIVININIIALMSFLDCVGLSTYEFVVQQRKRKSEALQKPSTDKGFKLGLYLKRLKTCLIAKVRRKRVKPSDLKSQLNPMDGQSIKSLSSSSNVKSSHENVVQTYQKGDKDIEKGEEMAKFNGEAEEEHNLEEHCKDISDTVETNHNFTKLIEKEKMSETEKSEERRDDDDHKMATNCDSNDSFTEEPIFKPLNPSFGHSGRTSRLSFSNGHHFKMPSVSPDFDLNSKFNSNHMIVRFNSYAKYKNKNIGILSANETMKRKKEIDCNDDNVVNNQFSI